MSVAYLYADPAGILDAIVEAKLDTGETVGSSAADRKRVRAEIEKAQRELRALLSDARLTVYRALTIGTDGLKALKAGDRLGTAWSYDPAGAHAYDGRSADALLLSATASVSAQDVAWDHTIAVHCAGEGEIRLRRDAPVTVLALTARPNGRARAQADAVRPDLVGATLLA